MYIAWAGLTEDVGMKIDQVLGDQFCQLLASRNLRVWVRELLRVIVSTEGKLGFYHSEFKIITELRLSRLNLY